MRYKITFSYDGSEFCGYQVQPGLRTVQGELEKAATYINQKKMTSITGSGRTDAKVHAYNQTAHFEMDITVSLEKLKRAFNSNLPIDIHVNEVELVDNDFHARFQVKSKVYIYKLNMGEYKPFDRNYIYQYNRTLNVEKMIEATKAFIGTHDFRSFISSEDKRDNTTRTVFEANITQYGEELIFMFKADGFLKYQVRNMVGTLIEIGSGKKISTEIVDILKSRDRNKAGKTAPACGLYLKEVNY